MNQEGPTKEKSSVEGKVLFEKGPQREYLATDTLWKYQVGSISYWDVFLTIVITIGYAGILFNLEFSKFIQENLHEDELELWEAIEYYKQGKFHLSPLGSLGIQLYSLIPRCKPLMRIISLLFASTTLGTLYLGQRRTGVSPFLAFSSVSGLGYLPLFQLQASQICMGPLQWLLLSLIFYHWQSFTYYPQFSIQWIYHLVILAVCLGLDASTKYLGFATWGWISMLALIQFWNTIGDIKLSSCFVAKYALIQVVFLTLIPATVFVTSNTVMLSHWTQDSPEFSKYMSSNFKSFLRGPIEYPAGLNYGSVVTLRHLESLGGYLQSHNYTYQTGSFGQQVTLTQEENDPNNEWIVEYKFSDENNIMINKKIHDGDEIRFRHRITGKLLRTSQAKPPVTGEEYDMEVSATGDSSYAGAADELWTIRVVNGPRHSIIRPLESIIKIQNEAHSCDLISHDTRLPDWGFNQQEVLCVDEATESRTHFYFELVKPVVPEVEEHKVFYCTNCSIRCTAARLIEYWQRQLKYNSYERNNQKISPYAPESWPFNLFGDKLAISIWIGGSLSPLVFAIYEMIQLFKWNPYAPVAENTIDSIVLDKVGIECSLGWFLHYNPFFRSSHLNLDVTLYIPALILGQLVTVQIVNALYRWNHWSLAVLIAYCATVFYS